MNSVIFLKLFTTLVFLSIPASSQLTTLFYPGFENAGSNLTLNGNAEIQKNGVLKLTNETSRLLGHAFYASPFRFKNSSVNGTVSSFSTSFAFVIVPEYPRLGGHGLAFAISLTKELVARPSQYLGLMNSSDVGNFSNHIFAVEFDTVQDFEFEDINDNHVGVDLNSMISNCSVSAAYLTDDSIKHDLNLKGGKAIKVWIDYDSASNVLDVMLSPFSSKPRKPILSYKLDLSPIFEEFMYVGFSASTGLLASSHYILGWSFKINGQAQDLDLSSLPSPPGPKKKHTALTVGVSVTAVILILCVIFVSILIIRKIKNADIIEPWELEVGPHRYSYKELKKATRRFRDKEVLGHGGFGKVYKGTLPDSQTQVAIKRISQESKQGLREFISEIATIGRLRHRNLVQLLGWCRRKGDLLLVYDFMANGSLDRFIFDEPGMILTWEQRFRIIKDVASGLLYLHEGYEQAVIHRDLKASNVLLDSELNGRLSDFGLARLYEHGTNPGTTRVVGTLGYIAPEVPKTGKATPGSDVYGFGMLLLEVVCGRRPIEQKALPEEMILLDWVWDKYLEGRLPDAVDPKLNGDFNEVEVEMVLKLGLMCSNNAPSARPNMRQTMRYLDGEIGVPEDLCGPDGVPGSRKSHGDGFDEFVHTFDTNSINRMSTYSSADNRDIDASFASFSTFSLVSGRD